MAIPNRFASTLSITRAATGSYVDGEWTEGLPTTVTVTAVVQPLRGKEREMLPETARMRGAVKVYSNGALTPADESADRRGDRFAWDGRTWEVYSVEHQAVGGLTHYKALAVLVEPDA